MTEGQDGIFPAVTAKATATAPSATFIATAYEFLSQLSIEQRKQLRDRLNESLTQMEPATLSGTAQLDPITATGTLSGTAAGTSTVIGTLTEPLPQPQAKQLKDILSTGANVLKTLHYVKSVLDLIEHLEQLIAKYDW